MPKQRFLPLLFTALIVLLLFPLIAFTGSQMLGDTGEKRPDILVIDMPSSPDHEDMPLVYFKHDLHSQAVDGQCAKCHDKKKDTKGKETTAFTFKRVEDVFGDELMDLYHDNCVDCHAEMKKAGEPFGPLAAECRKCHTVDSPAGSSWKEISFNRSLHFRHESAKTIPPSVEDDDTNCMVCHHSYNEINKSIFYQKGEEEACSTCHKPEKTDGIRAAGQAAHDSCVACHLNLQEKHEDAGPVECAGCHDAAKQALIKVVKDVPRMKRNQPDVVLMTGWVDSETKGKDAGDLISGHMNPVAFDHKAHEIRNDTCKVCHHEGIKKCGACHAGQDAEKGGFVKLAGAMHKTGSSHSCIGCHNEMKTAKECAGCHYQMPKKEFKDTDCNFCHSVDVKDASMETLQDESAMAGIAEAAVGRRNDMTKARDASAKLSLEKVPETVTIKVIADEYQPSVLPHRAILKAIIEKVDGNGMAKAFHDSEFTLCMGCHHNSPASMNPPKCASCHGLQPDIQGGKPGLKGAYHGQCITCHQKMDVKSVLPTDCTRCHEKK